jgi:hypothetical protein
MLIHDVAATIGSGHEDAIRHEASARRAACNDPNCVTVDSAGYLELVAENIQQEFHDCFIDITWPECPLHRRHPLWLHGGSWVCEQLDAPLAALGELRTSCDSAGRYVILMDRPPAPAG